MSQLKRMFSPPLLQFSGEPWLCQAPGLIYQVASFHWQWQEDPTVRSNDELWTSNSSLILVLIVIINEGFFTLRTLSSSVSTNCSTDISYCPQRDVSELRQKLCWIWRSKEGNSPAASSATDPSGLTRSVRGSEPENETVERCCCCCCWRRLLLISASSHSF